jgi:hypothetical protein
MTSISVNSVFLFQPDSEKSTPEHVGDMVKGKVDSVASKVQPEVYKLYIIHSSPGLDSSSRIRSPQASKSVTHSLVVTERAV